MPVTLKAPKMYVFNLFSTVLHISYFFVVAGKQGFVFIVSGKIKNLARKNFGSIHRYYYQTNICLVASTLYVIFEIIFYGK